MTWDAEPVPGGWRFTEPTSSAFILLDFIHPTSRGLDAWVELRMPDVTVPISEGTRNLMAPAAIAPFLADADHYQNGTKKDDRVPWETGLRAAFHHVIEEHRDGAATVDLTAVEPTPLQFLVDPLVEAGGMTRLIAPGGSGKSILAMAVCLTVATGRRFLGMAPTVTGPVLFLDWETNAATHSRRIQALCEPLGAAAPDRDTVLYRNETAPLFRSAQAVRRICDRFGVVMVIVDSAKMAAGPSGGFGASEDAALNLFLALREIGRPGLIIDHKTKDDMRRGLAGGHGSVYYTNLARMEWEMMKLSDPSATERSFTLELKKENNVGRLPALGFKMETSGDAEGIKSAAFIRVHPDDVTDPDTDDMTDRIAALLGGSEGALSVTKIADMLYGAEEGQSRRASIRARLNQDRRFENIGEGKVGAWRLAGDVGVEGEQARIEPDWTKNTF